MPKNDTRLLKYAGLLFLGLIIVSKENGSAAAGKFNYLVNQYGQERINLIGTAYQALKDAGFNSTALRLALAQVLHETELFSYGSQVARLNNNYSGIMWINKPYQVNATMGCCITGQRTVNGLGSPFPGSEGNYYYARFATPLDWAKDFKRILQLSPGYPYNKTTVGAWTAALKQNGYYTAPESQYRAGMQRYYDLLTGVNI